MYRYKGVECDSVEEVIALMNALDGSGEGRVNERPWIDWDGVVASSPIPNGQTIEIKMRSGTIFFDSHAETLRWKWVSELSASDIVAYRLLRKTVSE